MSAMLLAGTRECRNGNCPTTWLSERGTVLVQGYAVTGRIVRVPRDLLERAARELDMHLGGRTQLVPAPRSAEIRAVGGWFQVAGSPTSLPCPDGERVHEVAAQAVLAAASESMKEAEAV